MEFSLEGTTLHVSDVERSLEFYGRIPGAVVQVHRPGVFALLKIGKSRLGLLGVGASGQFHIEIGTADLDSAYERVREAGIEPEGPPKDSWGDRSFLVKDPDGYWVEFDAALEEGA
jgi:catechol 2,3-dioxygenase-like lactoylglutathione lyase family enzyme